MPPLSKTCEWVEGFKFKNVLTSRASRLFNSIYTIGTGELSISYQVSLYSPLSSYSLLRPFGHFAKGDRVHLASAYDSGNVALLGQPVHCIAF